MKTLLLLLFPIILFSQPKFKADDIAAILFSAEGKELMVWEDMILDNKISKHRLDSVHIAIFTNSIYDTYEFYNTSDMMVYSIRTRPDYKFEGIRNIDKKRYKIYSSFKVVNGIKTETILAIR